MPGIGSRGEALKVVIKGTSFWGASEVFVRSGTGATVTNFTVDAKNQITAYITISNSAGIGSRDVSVTTPGGTGTITDGFEIVGVSPSSGSRGSTLSVVITGTGFTEASELSFGEGIFVNSFTVDSPTQITAGISVAMTATPGPRDITVTTPVGSQIIASSFTVAQPTCTTGFTANRTTGTGTTTVKFTDTSSGDITGWAWDFNGDGKTDSIEKNPSYTYNRNGNYTVTLTVSGPHCENTLTKQAYIKISGCST
jgi:PKD repeat protein